MYPLKGGEGCEMFYPVFRVAPLPVINDHSLMTTPGNQLIIDP